MNNRIEMDELESYLWNSAVLLRTSIDAGAYKQYIFPLLFFKRICDVYDEEIEAALEKYGKDIADFEEEELHTFIVPKGYHWKDVREVSENVGIAIVNAFHAIEKANIEQLHGVFGDGACGLFPANSWCSCTRLAYHGIQTRLRRSQLYAGR